MPRRLFVTLAALALMAVALPALAVTDGGVPDDGAHPQVGQLLFYVPDAVDPRFDDPGAWFNCSGTLLDGSTVLTAGHCTFGVGLGGVSTTADSGFDPRVDVDGNGLADNGSGGTDIWFTTDEAADYTWIPNPSSYYAPSNNAGRYADWSAALDADLDWVRGTAYPHTQYNDAAFFLHDAGVVELDGSFPGLDYGQLPDEGYLDQFLAGNGNSKAKARFVPVGYGLHVGFPFYLGDDTRWKAEVMIIDGTGVLGLGPGTSLMFTNSPGKAHPGGTCFGDSGGPVFHEESEHPTTIVAVTSFGLNQPCAGTGGGYRIDQQDDLDFIGPFIGN